MHEKIVLPNGVRILYEKLPYVRSASIGLWTKNGSRYESARQNGVSHFIEHMVFKGTARRSAAQLAEEMDGIGGQVNAFTTKELTCFHARVLDTHMPIALDVLCDMFFDAKIAQSDVDTERSVILEEIGMYEDTPEDKVTEMLLSAVFSRQSAGHAGAWPGPKYKTLFRRVYQTVYERKLSAAGHGRFAFRQLFRCGCLRAGGPLLRNAGPA